MNEHMPSTGRTEKTQPDQSPEAYEAPAIEDLGTVESKTLTSVYF